MKKNYFLALVVMAGFLSTGTVFGADNTDSKSINAQANVTAAVTVTAGTPLDFKTIMPGVNKTINFIEGVTAGGTVGEESTGHFTINKGANTQVLLALSAPATLTGPATSTPIQITYTHQISGLAGVDPFEITTPTSFSVANTGLVLSEYWKATSFKFDLGGTIKPTATQLSGAYTTSITLTATYN